MCLEYITGLRRGLIMDRDAKRVIRVLCQTNPPKTHIEIARRARTHLFRVKQFLNDDSFMIALTGRLAEARRFGD